jgi:hypothetical protein
MLKKLLKCLINARQAQADKHIADMLWRTEFRNETYESVVSRVKRRDFT